MMPVSRTTIPPNASSMTQQSGNGGAAWPRRGIVGGGNWIVDHVKMIDRYPDQDTLANVASEEYSNGGAPFNVLVDLAHLGFSYPLSGIGLLGRDELAEFVLDRCRSNRIDPSRIIQVDGVGTSYTDVMTVAGTGRRTFFHHRGANALLASEHFDFTGIQAKIFHLGYLLLLDRLDAVVDGMPVACRVLERARSAGLLTSLDCVSEDTPRIRQVVMPTLPYVDVLFANDFETEKLTGTPLRSDGAINSLNVGAAARKLVKAGVRGWVVIHFPEGVYACDAAGHGVWQGSLRIPEDSIRGAAGAGDALAAGVLFGLHEGWSMEESLQLGVAAAGASLFDPTCSGGVRSAAECRALAAELGYRTIP
jgi:sugar/nucleoside kinase (ribokinase family)